MACPAKLLFMEQPKIEIFRRPHNAPREKFGGKRAPGRKMISWLPNLGEWFEAP